MYLFYLPGINFEIVHRTLIVWVDLFVSSVSYLPDKSPVCLCIHPAGTWVCIYRRVR